MSSNNWVLDCGCSILMLLRLLFLRHGIHSCLLQFNVGEGQMLVLCQLTWEVVARELRTAKAQFELITSLLLASDHGQLKEDQTRLPASQYTFYLKLEVGSNSFMIHPHSLQILAVFRWTKSNFSSTVKGDQHLHVFCTESSQCPHNRNSVLHRGPMSFFMWNSHVPYLLRLRHHLTIIVQ